MSIPYGIYIETNVPLSLQGSNSRDLTLGNTRSFTLKYPAVLIYNTGSKFGRIINLVLGLILNSKPEFWRKKKKSRSSYLMKLSLFMMNKSRIFKKNLRSSDGSCEGVIAIYNYDIKLS